MLCLLMTDHSVINSETRMARPRTEPIEARRRRILDAARAVMIRKEYEDVALDDVARQADIAKGTLYLYFKSKEDLMSAVFADMSDDLHRRLGEAGGRDPLQDLRRVAEVYLDFIDENHDFMAQILRQDPVLNRKHSPSPLRRGFYDHLRKVAAHVRRAIQAGALRPHDPRFGALHLMSLIRMLWAWKALSGSKKPLRQNAAELMDMFIRGAGMEGAAR